MVDVFVLKFQMYLERAVSCSCARCWKETLCTLNLVLNWCSVITIYILVAEAVETVVFCKAGTFQRAFVFSSAVASIGACVVISAKDLRVVALDNSFHI